jgi:hypothetical protein
MSFLERNRRPRKVWDYTCGEILGWTCSRHQDFINVSIFRSNQLLVAAHLEPGWTPTVHFIGIQLDMHCIRTDAVEINMGFE